MIRIKKIKGFKGYFVTDSGKVLSEYKGNFRWLKHSKLGSVRLCSNGEHKSMLVYRMVAQAFVPIPEQYQGMSIDELDVHHSNFNHNDNRESNLMWLTKSEHKKLHSESEVTKKRMSEAKKGKLFTEEHKRKLSEALKGRLLTEETKQKMSETRKGKQINRSDQSKAVIQYTKEGEFVAEYASIKEAERLTNIACQSICTCCRGKLKSAGGFKWKYAA